MRIPWARTDLCGAAAVRFDVRVLRRERDLTSPRFRAIVIERAQPQSVLTCVSSDGNVISRVHASEPSSSRGRSRRNTGDPLAPPRRAGGPAISGHLLAPHEGRDYPTPHPPPRIGRPPGFRDDILVVENPLLCQIDEDDVRISADLQRSLAGKEPV